MKEAMKAQKWIKIRQTALLAKEGALSKSNQQSSFYKHHLLFSTRELERKVHFGVEHMLCQCLKRVSFFFFRLKKIYTMAFCGTYFKITGYSVNADPFGFPLFFIERRLNRCKLVLILRWAHGFIQESAWLQKHFVREYWPASLYSRGPLDFSLSERLHEK